MTTHFDVKGVLHTLQPGFYTGDITILSDCKRGWRVKKSVLAAASSVFKDLISGPGSQGNELRISDETSEDIATFMDAICNKEPKSGMTVAKSRQAIELLIKFDCIEAAKSVLHRTTEDIAADDLFDAFALASRLGDVYIACRILAQGYKWHVRRLSVHAQKSKPLLTNLDDACWSPKNADMIQARWVWALSLASPQISSRNSYLTDKKHWRGIVAEFMLYLSL